MEKLRVGLIGCGEIARNAHLPGWAGATNGEIVAICDIREDEARKQGARFGITDICTDYKEMLDRDDIDAVDICLPHFLHGPVGAAAAEAGKHVLVEKPITTTLEQAVELIDAAERKGVKLMCDQIRRFTPAVRFMKQVVESGAVVDVTYVGSRHFHLKDIITQAKTKDQGWKVTKAGSGGGATHRDGIHHIDIVRWLAGAEAVRVSAEIGDFIWKQEVESCGHVLLRFANGAVGEMAINWCTVHRGFGDETVAGTKGTVRAEGQRATEVEITTTDLAVRNSELNALIDDLAAARTGYTQMRPETLTVRIPQGRDPRTLLAEHFVDCIVNDRTPLCDGLESAKALEMVIGAYRSVEQNTKVDLPLFPLDRLYERGRR